jgi:GNAT superfamily N-acetyltransferase
MLSRGRDYRRLLAERSLDVSYDVRMFRRGDEGSIHALLKENLRSYKGIDRWNWIHQSNPLGSGAEDGDVWVAETKEGELIGYYANIRYAMWVFGKTTTGGQGVELVTSPAHRHKGIATRLIEASRNYSKSKGLGVLFAFPNEASHGLQKKLGAVDVLSLVEADLVLERGPYLDSRYGSGPGRRAGSLLAPRLSHTLPKVTGNVTVESGFRGDAGDVWASLRQLFDVGIERLGDYLEWRYSKSWGDYEVLSAVGGGKTLGYAVYRMEENGGVRRIRICELATVNDGVTAYEALLGSIYERARSSVSYITASTNSSPGCRKALSGFGFRTRAALVGRLIGRRLPKLVAYPINLTDKKDLGKARWYQSTGDRDTA